MTQNFPTHADVVVIGGGIIGCSTAYHLAKDHKLSVVLLEQNKLTSGSTWHAAGLVGQLRGKRNLTRLMQASVAVFDRLEAESGATIDWTSLNGWSDAITRTGSEASGPSCRVAKPKNQIA